MIAPASLSLIDFYRDNASPGGSEWTKFNRNAAFTALGRFLRREPKLDDLDAELFEKFRVWMRKQRYAPSTVRSRLGAIHSLWTKAYSQGLAKEPVRQFVRKRRPWETGPEWGKCMFQPVPTDLAPSPPAGSLAELLEQYKLERDITPSTVNQHRYTLTCFARFLGRQPLLADLTTDTVNHWLVSLQATKMSPNTIKSKRRGLLTLWRAAFESGATDRQPIRIRKIAGTYSVPVAWTVDEVRQLVATAAATPGRFRASRILKGPFWVAFIAAGIYSGLRLGDLLRIEFKQIEPSGWFTMIQRKTGYPIRCYFPPDALAAIAAIKTPKRSTIFGSAAAKTVLQQAFSDLVKRAGLKGSAKSMRRTAATMAECLQPGAASWLLGHRDASLARRHYIDASQVMQAKPLLPLLKLGG